MRKKFTLVASLAFAAALCAGAAANVTTADAATEWDNFAISASSVRLGTGKDGGGITLGWRFCAQSGTTNIRGTFTISDITIVK